MWPPRARRCDGAPLAAHAHVGDRSLRVGRPSRRWWIAHDAVVVALLRSRAGDPENEHDCRRHDGVSRAAAPRLDALMRPVRLPVPTAPAAGLRFSRDVIAWLRGELSNPRTYGRIGYLLLAGCLGIAEFIFLVTGIVAGSRSRDHPDRDPDPDRLPSTPGAGWPRASGGSSTRSPARRSRPLPPAAGRRLALGAAPRPAGRPRDLEGPHLPAAPVPVRAGLVHRHLRRARRRRSRVLTLPLWFWAIPDGIDFGVLRVDTALGGARADAARARWCWCWESPRWGRSGASTSPTPRCCSAPTPTRR